MRFGTSRNFRVVGGNAASLQPQRGLVVELGIQGDDILTFLPINANTNNVSAVSISGLNLAGAVQMNGDGRTLEYGPTLIDVDYVTEITFIATITFGTTVKTYPIYLEVRREGVPQGGDIWLEYEVTADDSGPTLSSPSAIKNGMTAFTASITTDDAGGPIKFIVFPASNPDPSVTQLELGQDGSGASAPGGMRTQAVSAVGVQNVSGSGLTQGNTYRVAFLQRDAGGSPSGISVSAPFTTDIDLLAPLLSAPTAAKAGPTTGTASVTTDEAGGTMYFVASLLATKPSETQMMAGQDSTGSAAVWAWNQPVTTVGVQTASSGPSGLTIATSYYIHFMQVDSSPTPNKSAVATSAAFTTDGLPIFVAANTVKRNTAPTASMVSNAYSVSNNPHRLLIAVMQFEKNAATQDVSSLAAVLNTTGGNVTPTWTKLVNASQYPGIYMAAWVNPPNESVTATFTVAAAFRGIILQLVEFKNVDQTTPIAHEISAYNGSNTGGNRSLTTTTSNCALMAVANWGSGNKTLSISGACPTVLQNGNSGDVLSTNDCTGVTAIGDAISPATYTCSITADAAEHNVHAIIAIHGG